MEKMRRSDRQMAEEQAVELMSRAVYGTLCTIGEDGYPYGIPLSHALAEGKLYFHCALEGKKLRNLQHNPKVSYVVCGENEVLASQFSMAYESAIAFGTASEVTDPEEKAAALMLLVKKYSPEFETEGLAYANRALDKTAVYQIAIEQISGKHRQK